jgi:hypothetical protein
MKKIIGQPNHINQQQTYQEIKHESQPECTNPVYPFTKDRGCRAFPNHPNDKGRDNSPKDQGIPFFQCWIARKYRQSSYENIIVD